MATVGKDVSILCESRQRIGRDRSILTTNQRVASDKSILCATNLRLSKEISLLTKTVSSTYNTAILDRSRSFGVGVFIKNLTTGVTKQIPYADVEDVHISKRRNEPFSWSVTLDNRTRLYSPYNTGSEYYNWMFPDIWNSSGLIEKVSR